MDTKGKLILRQNEIYLREELNINQILPRLYQENVISDDDRQRIKAEVTERDKITKCLSIIRRTHKGYTKFLAVLKTEGEEHVFQKLEATIITDEQLKEEEQSIEDCVGEILSGLYREAEDAEVEYTSLKSDINQGLVLRGKFFKVDNLPLESIVRKTFPNVEYKAVRRKNRKVHIFKNLTRTSNTKDDDDDDDCMAARAMPGDSVDASSVQRSPSLSSGKHLHFLNETELCDFLRPKFLEKNISPDVLKILRTHEITGEVFERFTMEDLNSLMSDLSYGKKKSIMIIQESIIDKQDDTQSGKTFMLQESGIKGNTKQNIRESLRKFDTHTGMLGSYKYAAVLTTDIHRVHNLIEPVHMFIDFPTDEEQDIDTWLATKTIHFATACMNDRTNGTIHFGVKVKSNEDQLKGEVVGLSINKGTCNEAIKRTLWEMIFEEQIEMSWNCIRPTQFIPVVETGKDQSCYVVEIDVVPHADLLGDEAVFVRKKEKGGTKPRLYRFKAGGAIPEIQSDEQTRQYMSSKRKLSKLRKTQEEKPKPVKMTRNLRTKFLNVFSGGESSLTDETYPILIISPCDENSVNDVAENCFEFLQVLKPYAVFDFSSSTSTGSLYNYMEETRKLSLKVMTTDNFDTESEENRNDSERHGRLMDDLRNSLLKTWVFANGYDRMQRKDMTAFEWKRNRSQGFKEAMRYCYKDIPKGRATAIFLLLSKNYDIMLEAADEVLSKFQGQWILFAPSDDIAIPWSSELIRRNSVDKEAIDERCIIGMPWKHVNEMVSQVVGPLESSACQIPLSNGGYCTLRNKVRNELCDLDILSRQECDSSDILKDPDQKQENYRKVQEEFYHGGKPSWWNFWYKDDHICRRTKHENLMKYVRDALQRTNDYENKVPVVTLVHQPGSGGTTAARQILWDLRTEYRCCYLANGITDQTCDQIIDLRGYEESKSPRPPLVLLDNCDEEIVANLQAFLQKRAREAAIRCEEAIETFCVLLVCTRRTCPPRTIKDQTVVIRQELDQNEIDWFQKKAGVLKHRFEKDEGIDPKLLISFNILKENFNFSFIRETVKCYTDGIQSLDEKNLLLYLSLINTFDIDFQPIPFSAFDALMDLKGSMHFSYGLALDHCSPKHEKQWQTQISSELKVLLNVASRSGQGSNLKALSIVSPLFAKEIFRYLQEESNTSTSSVMLQFLKSRLFNRQNRSVDQVIRIVNDVLMKREVLEKGKKKEKFSRLMSEILDKEDSETAILVLNEGFERTRDPRIMQHISRLYIHYKNWNMATEYANKATKLRPKNSYFWDTYGQVFKNQLFEKYNKCMMTEELLTTADTCEIIQVAKTGIEMFHKEQTESEQDRHASQNDAGYFGEVKLIVLLVKILQCSPFELSTLHRFIVDKRFQTPVFDNLNVESRDVLKSLHENAEKAMRKMEEKSAQLKETISIDPDKHRYLDELAYLQEIVDNIFGEIGDEVPSHLSPIDNANYRRRRVRRLGGRSLTSLLRMQRKITNTFEHLEIMFEHLIQNVWSPCLEPFDIVLLISVALVRRIIHKKESVTSKLPQTLELTKRLYDGERCSKKEQAYLEVFLFLVMFHWPTENRKGKSLCPIGTLRDAIERWKLAFVEKYPRQRDDANPHRQKEATLFFLGKDPADDEIVYYEELHGRDNAVYFKADAIWRHPDAVNMLQRLEGTLMKDGLEVLIQFKTASGNIESLTVPTSMPVGQRSLWQKRVFFFLGFTWAGPKAFDVSSDDRQDLIRKLPASEELPNDEDCRHSTTREKIQHAYDPTMQIDKIRRDLKNIERLKKKRTRTPQQNEEIAKEESLKKSLQYRLRKMEDVFGD